jgi:hypothetical protein
MRRYLSFSKSDGARRASVITADSEKTPLTAHSEESPTATTVQAPLPNLTLKIKKVDHFYSRWSRKWKYENSGSHVIPELRTLPSDGKDDPWQQFCFVVVREIPREVDKDPYFKIHVKSPYLLKACKEVIKEVQGVSWNAIPLQVISLSSLSMILLIVFFQLDPHIILAFLPQFQSYRDEIKAKGSPSEEESHVLSTVDVLIDYLRKDYRATVASIENLTSHGEINFELLYAIMVPRTILITKCPMTEELQAVQLMSATKIKTPCGWAYTLICEGIDVNDSDKKGFYRYQTRLLIHDFDGTVKITSLDAYPIQYHPQESEISQKLVARGTKWSSLRGIHHMNYQGTAAFKCQGKVVKYNVCSLGYRAVCSSERFTAQLPNHD